MTLSFKIDQQTIRRVYATEKPAGDSVGYLRAAFDFSPDWDGLVRTAIFTTPDGETHAVLLDGDDACMVPQEVIKPPCVYISVRGDTAIDGVMGVPTMVYRLAIAQSGAVEGVPGEPTPDAYQQIVGIMQTQAVDATRAETAQEAAEEARDDAGVSRDAAALSEHKAGEYETAAKQHRDDAQAAASDAGISAGAAYASEVNAAESEGAALDYAARAETAAADTDADRLSVSEDRAAAEAARETTLTARSETITAKNTAVTAAQTATEKATSAANSATDANAAKNAAQTARAGAETAQGKAEGAQSAAESARSAAQIARTGAETAETNAGNSASAAGSFAASAAGSATDANTAKESAETARNEAVSATAAKADKLTPGNYTPGNVIMTDESGNIADSGHPARVLDGTYKRYGVSGVGGSNPSLTRLWDSVGLTAAAGTDTDAPTNDFDTLPPFNRRKCVGSWTYSIPESAPVLKFLVRSYHGDPDYAEDGTMGDYVAVEIDPFWYYQDDFSQNNPEQINGVLGVSATPVPGWQPHSICLNVDGSIRQKTYLPCYALALKDGKAVSLPGLHNVSGSYKALIDIARTYADTGAAQFATLEPAHVRHYEWLLFTIEYATTNCQSVMQGASNMPYSNSEIYQATVATVGETDNNKFILANAGANAFVVGQVLAMGTAAYAETHKRVITAIEDYDAENKVLVFDGPALDVPVGYWSNSRPYMTGACNSVLTPSGSPVSNTSGKYPMRYRWRENIWGNQYSTCHDLMARRIGDGTEESPYYVAWYYLIDPDYYPSSTSKPDETDLDSDAWIKLDGISEYADGYISRIAMDKRFPAVIFPIAANASSATHFADRVYLIHETNIVRAVRFGGHVANGARAGVLFFYAHDAPSFSPWYSGGGLYFPQQGVSKGGAPPLAA